MSRESIPVDPAVDVDAFFWEECARRIFWLQQCADCDQWQYYPRALCSHCWSTELVWRRPSGKAVLKTFSVVQRGSGGFAALAPYVVALVELAEGPTMMTNVVGIDPAQITIGMDLRLDFEERNERTVPVFRPGQGTS
ncbi:Zn-ribbon domain-containing OB-fold protein [Sciscionella marina]|uniref:Zn-ribbon domain-containing OB-fold protein n=1 Tax=Sciscionella marina TaxID=508770 RepID=UPI00035FE7BE|nr:OB-fold domain-containing protein [Sciscionella marina]